MKSDAQRMHCGWKLDRFETTNDALSHEPGSEWVSKRCEQTIKRMSMWPRTYDPIHGSSELQRDDTQYVRRWMFGAEFHYWSYTVGQNNQESKLRNWATRSSVLLFACTAHFAHSLACKKVNDWIAIYHVFSFIPAHSVILNANFHFPSFLEMLVPDESVLLFSC